MKLNNLVFLGALSVFLFTVGCGTKAKTPDSGPRTIVTGLPNGSTLTAISGPNVIPLTVNGSTCGSGANDYQNKPCVSVRVCQHGFTDDPHCKTIDNILLDTGSFGLRIFRSLITDIDPLSGNESTGLAECAAFGDGSTLWGPIAKMDVTLTGNNGTETASNIPIQEVDASFGTYPTGSVHSGGCASPSTSPLGGNTAGHAGFNGILGVGLFVSDCGDNCALGPNHTYFKCTDQTHCPSFQAVDGADPTVANHQVVNPIPFMVASDAVDDSNGLVLELPSVPLGGVPSIEGGYLVLGVGSRSNNTPSSSVTAFAANGSDGNFNTTFNGQTYGESQTGSDPYAAAFIDSGSNGYYFPSSLPSCGGSGSYFYCPATTTGLQATTTSADLATSGLVSFFIGNLNNLTADGTAWAFIEMGGYGGTDLFDWGLPFFIGRNVYIGFEGKTSTLQAAANSNTYWAY